jgi:hypothetical protein
MQTAVTYWAIDNKSWSKPLKSLCGGVGKHLQFSALEEALVRMEKGTG